MATFIGEPSSRCILLGEVNSPLEESQGQMEDFVDKVQVEVGQTLREEQIGREMAREEKGIFLDGEKIRHQLDWGNKGQLVEHKQIVGQIISHSLTLNMLNNLFDQIFFQLNSRLNSYSQTVDIFSRHLDLIKDAIKLFRNSDEDIRFDPNFHKIDKRCIKDLDKKKISKYLVPAHCLEDGNCLFRAACQAQFGHQNVHMPLRICCVFVLISHLEYFENNSTWNSKNMKSHIANMARDRVWGEEDEQMALSFIFRKPIVVLSSLHSLEYNSLFSEKDPLVIYFDANPGHFTSILLKESVTFYYDVIRPEYLVIDEKMIDKI